MGLNHGGEGGGDDDGAGIDPPLFCSDSWISKEEEEDGSEILQVSIFSFFFILRLGQCL